MLLLTAFAACGNTAYHPASRRRCVDTRLPSTKIAFHKLRSQIALIEAHQLMRCAVNYSCSSARKPLQLPYLEQRFRYGLCVWHPWLWGLCISDPYMVATLELSSELCERFLSPGKIVPSRK